MKNKTIYLLLIATALIMGAMYVYYNHGHNSTLNASLGDFAFEDTASIERIFMKDKHLDSVLLERKGREWTVNGKSNIRQEGIRILLETIHDVRVKAPVPKSTYENIIKQLATKSVRVEIYTDGNEPDKVYYVGGPDQEHTGTYMLLADANVPFLTHIEGFKGFLTPRYVTDEFAWFRHLVFQYGPGAVAAIKIEYPRHPEDGFLIQYPNGDKGELYTIYPNKQKLADADSVKLRQYPLNFTHLPFENHEETKSQALIDSVKQSTPMTIITVTDRMGNTKELKTFLKPAPEGGGMDYDGNPVKYDVDRFYGLIDGEEFVVLQYFVYDPATRILNDFRTKD